MKSPDSMMKHVYLIIITLFVNLTIHAQVQKDYTERAQDIYKLLRAQEFGKVVAEFDSSIAKRIDSTRLATAWANLIKMEGNFVKVIEITTEIVSKHTVIIQKSEFEKRSVDFKLAFGDNGKVKGIFLTPEIKKFVFSNPDYYDSTKFVEKRKFVVTGEYRLPAILTLPTKSVAPPPVAILVHGSGPNDKDETVGNTKIFRDLAVGLSAQGIAVLRFDKRTRNFGKKMASTVKKLTVKEETIDDVISAIKMLELDSTVNGKRIYLIGHSLGGMLLPRIVEQSKDISGIVMMAANSRPMEDLMLEQMEYLQSFDSSSQHSSVVLDSMRTEISKIKKLSDDNANDTIGLLGVPVSYWLDLKKYDQIAVASSIKMPILILHGNRDYQVTNTDYSLWHSKLKDYKNVSFRSYEKLNHFFIAGEGKSRPEEYDLPGHVDKQVINDISSFIRTGHLR